MHFWQRSFLRSQHLHNNCRHNLNFSTCFKLPEFPNKNDFAKPSMQDKICNVRSRAIADIKDKKVLSESGR